tara:strand:- start:304 stop:618 length:315 start_codon:yes stop_codon:yes gene_type:complete
LIDLKSQKLLDETTNGKWRKFVSKDKIEKENKMTLKNILDKLIDIENELDDATNTLPDWNGNSESRSNIDGAKCELYHLKDEIERMILDEKKEIEWYQEWAAGC